MAKSKTNKQPVSQVFMYLSAIMAVVLFVIGGLAFWAYSFTSDMVTTELSAQKIYFPEKGSPAFEPSVYPDIQQYAGQLVDTPQEAEAYANGYIGRHLAKVADGKVYAEVSAEAMKDPTNEVLQKQKATLFQGETLRGILLTSGYGFGTIGNIAGVASVAAFALAGLMALVAIVIRTRA